MLINAQKNLWNLCRKFKKTKHLMRQSINKEMVVKFLVVKAILWFHLKIFEGKTASICGKKSFVFRECALDCSSGDWIELEGSDLVGSRVEIEHRESIVEFFNGNQ